MALIMKEVVVPANADGSWSYDLPSRVQRVEIYGERFGPPDFPCPGFYKDDKHVQWKRCGGDEKALKLYAPDVDGLSIRDGMARGESVTLKIYHKEVA